jgi:hypothetical protein
VADAVVIATLAELEDQWLEPDTTGCNGVQAARPGALAAKIANEKLAELGACPCPGTKECVLPCLQPILEPSGVDMAARVPRALCLVHAPRCGRHSRLCGAQRTPLVTLAGPPVLTRNVRDHQLGGWRVWGLSAGPGGRYVSIIEAAQKKWDKQGGGKVRTPHPLSLSRSPTTITVHCQASEFQFLPSAAP